MISKESAILLTGAAGFIGSYLLGYLNKQGFRKIIIVDDFDDEDKWFNIEGKAYSQQVDRELLFDLLGEDKIPIDFVIHLGARTDTSEFDYAILEKWNVEYSKKIWRYCAYKKIPLIYASSAATYGRGELGFIDNHDIVEKLQPLNPYGVSKNEFDKWALQQEKHPPFWYGLKFFNVYGPNEYHKDRMASMVFHGFNQIQKTGKLNLFKSYHPDFPNGGQLRDFIFVKDVASVCSWLMMNKVTPGLYNVGTGKARSFLDLAQCIFHTLKKPIVINFIEMPADIKDNYQYFTESDMTKLRKVGYNEECSSIEDGIEEYIQDFLIPRSYY